MAYAVSFAVGLALLGLTGRPGVFDSFGTAVSVAVALALPAAVGGAAGRIIV